MIRILLILLVAFIPSFPVVAFDFEEIHVSGPCQVVLRESADSAGMVVVEPGQPKVTGLEVRRVSEVLFVELPSKELPDRLLRLRVYYSGNIRLIDAGGRASVIAPAIHSDNALSVISSGAASVRIGAIVAKNINISLSGSGTVALEATTAASTLNLSLTGSGRIEVRSADVGHLTVTQRGSGRINLAGSARECAVVGFGSGRVDASGLVCKSMNLKQFASGQIFYNESNHVTVDGKSSNIHPVKPNR